MALGLAAACLGLFVALLVPLIYAAVRAPKDLTLLRFDRTQALRLTQLHKFPLLEAAHQSGREILAQAFTFQTELAVVGLGLIGVFYAWRGYSNPRPRGWTHYFWLAAVFLLFFAPALTPSLSLRRVDFAVSTAFSGERPPLRAPDGASPSVVVSTLPSAALFSRAVFGAIFAAFVGLAGHDAAHRLREGLVEFGLIADEAERQQQDDVLGRKPRGRARTPRDEAGAPRREEPEASGFGQRRRARATPPRDDPRARAYALLGVAVGAGKAEIERAYRAKMKRAHPDHGGSVELAAALNQARDMLLPHG